MRVGVIGCGAFGQNHVRNFSQMPHCELVGAADIDEDRLHFIRETYRAPVYKGYEDLLKCDLDAVTIAVPTTLHKKVACDVLSRGIHTLVEKPIASSVKEAETMIKTAQKEGAHLMVGHVTRFEPTILKLKTRIDRDELGQVISLSAKRVGPYHPRIRDVGIIIDLGVHDIDIISYLYGESAQKVFAVAGKTIHAFEDYASILMAFKSSKSGLIDMNWHTPHKVRKLTAVGTKSIVDIDYLDNSLTNYNSEWIRDAKIPEKEPLRTELEAFLSCIERDDQVPITGEDGLYTLRVALAAIKSYQEEREVSLRD
ncbi:MAG: Gfo/Idh/MocA family oxidoreductase [Theionarchaea archaeon]|nr:Gfo/Idh/MocA family oxidoreductase [Theionarchaea archaeon]